VPLSTGARAVLATMRKKDPTAPSDKIFPNRGGAPYVRIEYDPDVKGLGYYPTAVQAAGLKGRVTFHGLRHLFAVRCLARGIPMSVVSNYLGYTSIELTVKLYGRFGDDGFAAQVLARGLPRSPVMQRIGLPVPRSPLMPNEGTKNGGGRHRLTPRDPL
jgi:integrase